MSFQDAAAEIQKEHEQKSTAATTTTATTTAPATATTETSTATTTTATTEQASVTANAPTDWKEALKNAKPEELESVLKEMNITLPKKEEAVESPEDKAKREAREEMQSIDYAIANGKNKDELLKYKSLEGKAERATVYDDFREKQLAKNKNISEETINKRFEKEYPSEIGLEEGDDGYEDAKENFEWKQEMLKSRAEKLKEKALSPLQQAKAEFTNYKKGIETDNKLTQQATEYFAKQGRTVKLDIEGEDVSFDVPETDLKAITDEVTYALKVSHVLNQSQKFNIEDNFKKEVLSKYYKDIMKKYGEQTNEKAVNKALEPYLNVIAPKYPQSRNDGNTADEKTKAAAQSLSSAIKGHGR